MILFVNSYIIGIYEDQCYNIIMHIDLDRYCNRENGKKDEVRV